MYTQTEREGKIALSRGTGSCDLEANESQDLQAGTHGR